MILLFQIRIIVTQATGRNNVLLDLTAVRLASLNQTLDPWLYILFRRSTCMRIIKSVRQLKTKSLNAIWRKALPDNNPIEIPDPDKTNNDNYNCVKKEVTENENNHKSYNEVTPPDVMQNVEERSKLPLPDVTNTSSEHKNSQDSSYVCQLQFGKAAPQTVDNGMYVKILYLKNNSNPGQSDNYLETTVNENQKSSEMRNKKLGT